MVAPRNGEQARILMIDLECLFSAGLTHLLNHRSDMGTAQIITIPRSDLAAAVETHRPHVVVLPPLDLRLSPVELRVLSNVAPIPRLILVSPECPTVYVADLSQAVVTQVRDLLALIRPD